MKILIYVYALFFCVIINAQENTNENLDHLGSVSGKVEDALNEVLPFTTIVIKNSSGELLLGTISDEKGKFKIEKLPMGDLFLEISYTGYKPLIKNIKINIENLKLNLETLVLEEDLNFLEEVIIEGEKSTILIKRDMKVFNIGKDILAQSTSATDILNNVPSVTVDASGTISLRGNSNVNVLINGRRSGLTINNALDQIPAANIDRVEVITNPSARYDALGTAGIINIVLKKNKDEGLNGQLYLVAGTPRDFIVLPTVNYKNKNFNVFSTLGYRNTNYNGLYTSQQTTVDNGKTRLLDQVENEDRNDVGKLIYLGIDYFIDDKNTLTAAFFRKDTDDSDETVLNYQYFSSGVIDSTLVREGESKEDRSYNQVELNYTKEFQKEGRKFTTDFQYDFWDSEKDWNLETQRNFPSIGTPDLLRTNTKSSSKDYVLQSDYISPLSQNATFEFGIKGEARIVSNDFIAEEVINNEWEILNGINESFDYEELIGAAYAQYGNKVNKFSYLVGLRNEYTKIKIQSLSGAFVDNKEYNNLFPTVHLGYDFTDKTNLQLSFSRRINRPSLWDLYPFTDLKNINYLSLGNPDLDPAYTKAFELGLIHRWEKISLSSSVYYHITDNYFQNFVFQNSENILILQPINLEQEDRYGIEVTASYKPFKSLNLSSDFNFYRFDQKGLFNGQDLAFSDQFLNVRFRANAKLPKKISLTGMLNYTGGQNNAQTKTKSQYFVNLSVSKNLFNDKATIGFNAVNIFDSRITEEITTDTNYTFNRTLKQIRERFNVSFIYRFKREENYRDRGENDSNRN